MYTKTILSDEGRIFNIKANIEQAVVSLVDGSEVAVIERDDSNSFIISYLDTEQFDTVEPVIDNLAFENSKKCIDVISKTLEARGI